jgi:hypothetical protein
LDEPLFLTFSPQARRRKKRPRLSPAPEKGEGQGMCGALAGKAGLLPRLHPMEERAGERRIPSLVHSVFFGA